MANSKYSLHKISLTHHISLRQKRGYCTFPTVEIIYPSSFYVRENFVQHYTRTKMYQETNCLQVRLALDLICSQLE